MTDCLGCPRDDKNEAEFWWHPGGVGVMPDCLDCARENLPESVDRLNRYKRHKYEWKGPESFVSGYYTPAGESSPKIVTAEDLNAYIQRNDEHD